MKVNCAQCGQVFERPVQRGRPATKCHKCRGKASDSIQSLFPMEKSPTPKVSEKQLPSDKVGLVEETELSATYTYRVTVTNMGTAYEGNSEKEAVDTFTSFSKKSDMGYGQVGFEQVRLLARGEDGTYQVRQEHLPRAFG